MISGKTRCGGVIGFPVKQSLSPLVHNTSFQERDVDAVYLAFEVEKASTEGMMHAIRTLNMYGVNVTMPLKQEVIPFLDSCTETATLCQAVNSIIHRDGKLIGDNTDGLGFLRAAKEMGIDIEQSLITILGAGGAAKSILVALALANAKTVYVLARDGEKKKEIRKIVQQLKDKSDTEISLREMNEMNVLEKTDLLVNATSVGMKEEASLVDFSAVQNQELKVMDIIYSPKETKLLREARERGLQTENGLPMLLYQAALSFESWFGEEMPIEKVKEKLKEVLK